MDLAQLTDEPTQLKNTKKYDAGYEYKPPEHYLYFDLETKYTQKNSIKVLSLRDYAAYVTEHIEECTVAYGVDDGEIIFARYGSQEFNDFLAMFSNPAYLPVAHNNAFDNRICVLVFHTPYPRRSHCTMEFARRCWPCQSGGHGLKNLTKMFPSLPCKLDIDLENYTDEELEAYNIRDTEGCRELHKLEMSLMPPEEILIAEQACLARSLVFDINLGLAATAKDDFLAIATDLVATLNPEVFGWNETSDGKVLKSVKYQALKKYLADEMGFTVKSTSKKKINPELLRRNPEASVVIEAVSEIGKALCHSRRVGNLTGSKVDLGYAYYAAHTGRPSGRGEGKGGLNALNLPKHNKKIANIIRPLYELPDGQYFLCADFANIEYRTLGLITGCKHIYSIFENNVLADPYAETCHVATGFRPDKRNPDDVPMRQIFKQMVLSLTYLAGLTNWIHQMLIAISKGEVTMEQLTEVARKQRWRRPTRSRWVNKAQADTSAPDVVVAVCFHTYNLFHEVHPEFKLHGRWLVDTVEAAAHSLDPDHELEVRKLYAGAPDPEWLEITVDWDKRNERSITARCGLWSPTVCWRDIAVRNAKRYGNMEPCLTILHETKTYRPISPNILIENVNQSLARNAMCAMKLRMPSEFGVMIDIYDEIKMLVNRENARHARAAMLKHAGPGSDGCGYGWAVVIDPNEIEIARSFKGIETKPEWWDNPRWEEIP